MPTQSTESPGRSGLRWGVAVLAILALLALSLNLPADQVVASLRQSVAELGVWGPLFFVLVYVGATVLLVPGSALTLAAGALFGTGMGLALTSLASIASAAIAFLIARYLARDAVARRLETQPRFHAIDEAIGAQGWKIVGLLRLSPVVPFSVSNYLYGLTAIRFFPYVLISWLAMLPGTFLYVYLGALAADAVESTGAAQESPVSGAEWALRIVGLVATVTVTFVVVRIARRAIRESTDIENDEVSPAEEHGDRT
ncbi:MAG: TVP38/TMEM64 family protein [Myxococcota bacterium]